MQQVRVSLGDSIAIIKPVAFEHLATVGTLFTELHALWTKYGYALADLLLSEDGKLAQDLMDKIAKLHRRADVPGEFGFPIASLLNDLPQLEALFFMERNEGGLLDLGQGCQLLRLNRFNPEKKMTEARALASPAVVTPGLTSELI